MKIPTKLLRDSILKQSQFYQNEYWIYQIPKLCPPVLWFGNHQPEKKIVTVGLNPSHSEFFRNQDTAKKRSYLSPIEQRFYVYSTEDLENPQDPTVTNRVLQSYDNYFQNNPYTRWFGKPEGYNVERFVNQFEASFYGIKPVGCVHIDLFPFVTTDKFSDLDPLRLKEDVFEDVWFQEHFKKLIDFLNPQYLIVFGRSTVNFFNKYFEGSILLDKEFKANNKRYAMFGVSSYKIYGKNIPLAGLSVNLGDPRGFTKELLKQMGRLVYQKIKSDKIETWKQLPFLDYSISDDLLAIALKHNINQELAVLGDAVLKIAIREYYYKKGNSAVDIQAKDGTLGDNDYLYDIVIKKLKLQDYILSKNGLRNNPKINEAYARTLEAIIGAIYLENKIEPSKEFVEKWIISPNPSVCKG